MSSLENTLKNCVILDLAHWGRELGLIKKGFYFSHCEIPNMMDLTAFPLPHFPPHSSLWDLSPLVEPPKPIEASQGNRLPLSSSSSDSCQEIMEQFKTCLKSHNRMRKTFLSGFGISFHILLSFLQRPPWPLGRHASTVTSHRFVQCCPKVFKK